MNVYGVIVFVSLAVSPIFAQEDQTFTGTCPAIDDFKDFDEKEFAGNWYEIKRYVNTLITEECGLPNYIQAEKGYDVKYLTRNVADKLNSTKELKLKQQTALGKAGYYEVYIDDVNQNIAPHRVLDTDYTTYSIVWGCKYTSDTKTNIQRLSIYSRTSTLASEADTKITQFLKDKKLDETKLNDVQQGKDQCGRSSATTLVLPTIFSSIIVMLLTMKF